MSLEELSARTKIKLTLLQAIERGEFERLPGEFFTRAFLRTYAREVHLSPDAIAQAYDAARRAAEPPEEEVGSAVRESAGEEAGASWFDRTFGERVRPLTPPALRSVWPIVALTVILVAAIVFATRPVPGDANEIGAVGTTGADVAAGPPAGVPPAPEPAPDPGPETLTLEIRPSGLTWVAATADGERVVFRLLQPGDRVVVEARHALSVRIGNAAAFDFSINGEPGQALGDEGEVRDVEITRENYRRYLR